MKPYNPLARFILIMVVTVSLAMLLMYIILKLFGNSPQLRNPAAQIFVSGEKH